MVHYGKTCLCHMQNAGLVARNKHSNPYHDDLQELLLEVWHHCPRSQAVAAALSQGGTTSHGVLKYRDVFLGSGFAPLHALLNKPQVLPAGLHHAK